MQLTVNGSTDRYVTALVYSTFTWIKNFKTLSDSLCSLCKLLTWQINLFQKTQNFNIYRIFIEAKNRKLSSRNLWLNCSLSLNITELSILHETAIIVFKISQIFGILIDFCFDCIQIVWWYCLCSPVLTDHLGSVLC